MTFRFDDVCVNADMGLIQRMTEWLFEKFPDCKVIYGVSPLVHWMKTGNAVKDQRVFPEILNAQSDYRNFYRVQSAGIPEIDKRVIKAGHGLVHVDHRLLTKEVQELSIIASCSLVGAFVFIPPFNKWNKDTYDVCRQNGIELVKFENGWKSMEHNTYTSDTWRCGEFGQSFPGQQWYLHAREWTFEEFVAWFKV